MGWYGGTILQFFRGEADAVGLLWKFSAARRMRIVDALMLFFLSVPFLSTRTPMHSLDNAEQYSARRAFHCCFDASRVVQFIQVAQSAPDPFSWYPAYMRWDRCAKSSISSTFEPFQLCFLSVQASNITTCCSIHESWGWEEQVGWRMAVELVAIEKMKSVYIHSR